MMFIDREDAGRKLAERLQELELRDPLVLGIPRGGVVTGAAVARPLGADLDIVLARKLRAPWQPELAIGAVGEEGQIYLNPEAKGAAGVTDEYLEEERERQAGEIAQLGKRFRALRPAAPMEGRSVILTDDGIATGSTMMAAADVVKAHQPHEVIIAVPVGPAQRIEALRSRCDRLICLHAPETFWAVGQFYDSFSAVENDEVAELLREFSPEQRGAQ